MIAEPCSGKGTELFTGERRRGARHDLGAPHWDGGRRALVVEGTLEVDAADQARVAKPAPEASEASAGTKTPRTNVVCPGAKLGSIANAYSARRLRTARRSP